MPSLRIAALLLVLGLTLMASFGAATADPGNPPPAYGDVQLYRDITAQVSVGESYYAAATRLQRTHRYPVQPFYTVRPPMVAWANALLGDLRLAGCILLVIASLVWLHTLDKQTVFERTAALLFMLAAGLPLVLSPMRAVHDVWGGLFVTIALGLAAGRLSVIAASCAVLVRELNFPLLGLFALEKRSRSAALIAIGLCLAALVLHRQAVLAWILTGDPHSQGWLGLRGAIGWVQDLSENTLLQLLPRPAAALLAFAPLLGWIALGQWRALAWFAGVGVLVTILSRPDNSYWILNALPVWFIGLAFVPAFLRSLIGQTGTVTAERSDRAISVPTSP